MKKILSVGKVAQLSAAVLISLTTISCDGWDSVPDFDVEEVEGYRPVYATAIEKEVTILPPQELRESGKIYVIQDYLLVVEPLKGVHIFDNEDPKLPVSLGFIQISGNNDVAVRDNILYADQGPNLIAIDISNLNAVKVAAVVKNVFPLGQQYPAAFNTYFECVDPAKGMVVGWEQATLFKPECYH